MSFPRAVGLSNKTKIVHKARFIAPSHPFKGDQAVDAHAARAPALLRGEGLVYRTMCFEGL